MMMSERPTLRVALVGAGAAGQAHAFGYRNVSMAAGLESVQIDPAVVVDPNIELARRTADRYGYTDATADLRRVLDDPSIDAISVALPNSVHAEVLPAILRSDKTPPRPLNSLHWPGSPARSPVLGSRSGAYPVWPRCTTSWPPMRLARCTVSPRGTTPTTRPRPTHRSAGDTRRRPQAPVR